MTPTFSQRRILQVLRLARRPMHVRAIRARLVRSDRHYLGESLAELRRLGAVHCPPPRRHDWGGECYVRATCYALTALGRVWSQAQLPGCEDVAVEVRELL